MRRVRRLKSFLPVFATLTGVAFGVVADWIAGGVVVDAPRVAAAMFLSPVLVVVGGAMVDAPGWEPAFTLIGLLFWPVYALLVWRWFRTSRPAFALLLAVWSSAGFFQLLHRLDCVMSV